MGLLVPLSFCCSQRILQYRLSASFVDVNNTLPLAGYTIDLSGNIKINGSNVSWTSNGTYNVAGKFNVTTLGVTV